MGPRTPGFNGSGCFRMPCPGKHERDFILSQEDLKRKFQRFMRKNVRKLSVTMAQTYINTKLLKGLSVETLSAHGLTLPVCRDTAWRWMVRCGAHLMSTEKNYYNDQHENPEVREAGVV